MVQDPLRKWCGANLTLLRIVYRETRIVAYGIGQFTQSPRKFIDICLKVLPERDPLCPQTLPSTCLRIREEKILSVNDLVKKSRPASRHTLDQNGEKRLAVRLEACLANSLDGTQLGK